MVREIALITALLAAVPARAETVIASWYGHPFHGRIGAAGCRYDMYALTAAARDYPLGTLIEVSRAGRRVILLVNDRGPYVGHRRLDLSHTAAARLDMLGVGVAVVEVRVIGWRQPCSALSSDGSFLNGSNGL